MWNVRGSCRRGVTFQNMSELIDLVQTSLSCPWLVCCSPSKSKQERRASRVREPPAAPHAVIYRSDGASRGQGSSASSVAGWGAAAWGATPEGRGIGPPAATSRGFLGYDVSNNVAEYNGLLQCMRRATHVRDVLVVFEVDSMLLAKQMAWHQPWACRSLDLVPLHTVCTNLGQTLTELGIVWHVQHIYREYNQASDTLSNQAIDEQNTNGPSATW